MGAFVALVGWPDVPLAEAAGGWDASRVVLGAVPGAGAAVVAGAAVDGAVRAVLAGGLANRRELEDALPARGGGEGGRNDAALVVRLYEGRGDNAISALRGGFALALWDGRRRRLVLAHDQLGVRPLYYVAERGRCAASSALGPLLGLPDVAGSPDLACVDVLLAFGAVPAPATPYPGIRQLCPGELVVWEGGRHRTQRYWQLRFPEGGRGRRVVSREAARRAREQLDDVVRQRTAGAVTGLLLSGGVGATSLLALATALERRPAYAVTVAGGGEEQRATATARRAGVEHDVVSLDVDWVALADASLAAHGGPEATLDAGMLGLAMSHAATRTRVILAGAGIDDVLGGGPAERAWRACERYRTLPTLAREAADILAGTGWPAGLTRAIGLARSAPLEVFGVVETELDADARATLYGPALQAVCARAPAQRALVPLIADAVSVGATHASDTLYAVRLALGAPRTARCFAPATELAADVRLPFLDPRLAQLAAAVPAAVRASLGRRARLLHGALRDRVGRDVWRRPHQPPVPPPAAWRAGGLRTLLDDTLARERVARVGLFDPDAVQRMVAAHAGGLDRGALLWRLALVSRWLERPRLAAAYSSAPAATSEVIVSSS